jgi:hypothetical protein
MKKLDVDDTEIILRCVADKKSELLERAVLNGWKQCQICKYPICNDCLHIFLNEAENESVCPGTYLKYNHNLIVENIPTEIILIEAKKQSKLPPTGILISKAFYLNIEEKETTSEPKSFSAKYENKAVSLARKEEWANMGSVIVKRNRGKYISWERL